MGDVCVGSGSELRPGCLLMLALFLQALSAAADLALFFFLLHFFSLLFVTSHRLHAAQTRPTPTRASAAVGLKQTLPGANDQDP